MIAHMRLAVGVLELVGEPVEPLVQPVAGGGARRLDVPVAVAQRVQTQLVRYFGRVHSIWQILLTKQIIINKYDSLVFIRLSLYLNVKNCLVAMKYILLFYSSR